MKFLHVSPGDALVYARRLADSVINSGFKPDTIVAILRGGVVIARLLSDFLDVRDIRSIRVVHYEALDIREGAEVVEPLPTRLDGKKVLLVDDVADTGDSLIVAKEHLEERGAAEVRVATMH
ncbi:MAG: phosphoribosyltransferase, partial [Candidatus Korarchaeota archaeon]|nr:phosphoribosyltransferase [Candidatus Korarchaeota archaeon]